MPPGAASDPNGKGGAGGGSGGAVGGAGPAPGTGGAGFGGGGGGSGAGPGGGGGGTGAGTGGTGGTGAGPGGTSGTGGGPASGGSGGGTAGSGGGGGGAGGGGGGGQRDGGRDQAGSPGGSGGGEGGAGGAGGSGGAGGAGGGPPAARFSFFVTSLEAMQQLSGSQLGFGGKLGGLAGADMICQTIGERAGGRGKTWRAFLSVVRGPEGTPVHAIDRIGNGPWYDKNGRLVAMNRQGLLAIRPMGDAQAVSDLANENGQPQKMFGDNHDVITGSNAQGMLLNTNAANTCNDWTSADANLGGRPICGHSWSRGAPTARQNWLSEHTVPGCAPGVNLRDNTVMPGNCIGCNGGYGGIYCFALTP